jgi:hypothetical protein
MSTKLLPFLAIPLLFGACLSPENTAQGPEGSLISSSSTSNNGNQNGATIALISKYEGEIETCTEYAGKHKDLLAQMGNSADTEVDTACPMEQLYGTCDLTVTAELVAMSPESEPFLGEDLKLFYYKNSINNDPEFGFDESLREDNRQGCESLDGKWKDF